MAVPRLAELTEARTSVMGRRSPAHVYSAQLDATSTTTWFGAPVTNVARTVVDQSRHSRRGGLMAADAALRERLVSEDEVRAELDAAAGWPGIRQARRIWESASPLAESALESVVRLLHVRNWRVERVMWRDVLIDWSRTCATPGRKARASRRR
jgi:hypothetical protein